jgi:hypothetical protein
MNRQASEEDVGASVRSILLADCNDYVMWRCTRLIDAMEKGSSVDPMVYFTVAVSQQLV